MNKVLEWIIKIFMDFKNNIRRDTMRTDAVKNLEQNREPVFHIAKTKVETKLSA